MSVISSVDPRTGEAFGEPFPPTTDVEVATLAAGAAEAAVEFGLASRTRRAALLRDIGAALEARRDDIVAIADAETGLGPQRLNGELTRTVYQANLFADVLDEGSYLEAAIDHAAETPMGPGPDLRRMLVPIGPVAVFGASNFPLAFSVPGGDTVSALAAGSPVILKAHESHPATSQLTYSIMAEALRAAGFDNEVLSIVYGREAGAALVADAHVKAVSFTGSLRGGKALMDIINERDEPIPFYGELSSLNPVVLTEAAAAERGAAFAAGLVTSITASAGQLCTKPGLVFVPSGPDGDAVVAAIAEKLAAAEPGVALNEGIADGYAAARQRYGDRVTAEANDAGAGFRMPPRLVTVEAAKLTPELTEECFGPSTVVARYSRFSDLDAALTALPDSLTAAIHYHEDPTASSADSGIVGTDRGIVGELTLLFRAKAGRVLYNGFPTGVRVAWAQTHGGPWPSTNTAHTSVGTTAIRRFLRPITWQDAPEHVLPSELRDEYPAIPRRVNGRLEVPDNS